MVTFVLNSHGNLKLFSQIGACHWSASSDLGRWLKWGIFLSASPSWRTWFRNAAFELQSLLNYLQADGIVKEGIHTEPYQQQRQHAEVLSWWSSTPVLSHRCQSLCIFRTCRNRESILVFVAFVEAFSLNPPLKCTQIRRTTEPFQNRSSYTSM